MRITANFQIRLEIIIFLWFIFRLFLSGTMLSASAVIDSTRLREFDQIQDHYNNEDFAVADSLCKVFMAEQRSDPLGYLMMAVLRMTEMTDREESLYGTEFLALIDTVNILGEELAKNGDKPTQAWAHLIMGHARGYRSLWEGRFGSFLSALKLGARARDEYEKGLELDSTLYDLHSGLGSYRYWKSSKVGVLRSIGLFKDEREEGIAELQIAVRSSLISRESAKRGLIWIWLDYKQYDSAYAIAAELHTKYPDCKAFVWAMARASYFKGDYQTSLGHFEWLKERLSRDPGNYFNLVESSSQVVHCLEELGRDEEAQQEAAKAVQFLSLVPKETLKRQKEHVSYLREESKTE
jgi:tetratricopeptide (TPR) repeat protein